MATAGKATDLRTLFISMPDSITPTLTKSDRMDFLDYMDSGMKASARNKLGGESVMTRFEENMLSIQTSRSGRMDMMLLRKGKDETLICIIRTVTAKYDDSRLSFFTEDWRPVPTEQLIELPSIDDYLTKEALKNDSIDDLVQTDADKIYLERQKIQAQIKRKPVQMHRLSFYRYLDNYLPPRLFA